MELNPYESPRVPQPGQEQELADSNSVRQLLVEIRDGQRELLQLQREALKTQLRLRRFGWVGAIIPLIIFGVVFGTLRTTLLRPPTIPVFPTPAPQVVPAPRTAPRPVVPPPKSGAKPPTGNNAAD